MNHPGPLDTLKTKSTIPYIRKWSTAIFGVRSATEVRKEVILPGYGRLGVARELDAESHAFPKAWSSYCGQELTVRGDSILS